MYVQHTCLECDHASPSFKHVHVNSTVKVSKLKHLLSWSSLSLSIQNNATTSEDCANGRDIRASYKLSYNTTSGTLIATCNVSGTECSNGTCHHELKSNTADSRCQPPVSQFSGKGVTVFVTARNTVGRSNPNVSRTISEFNSEGQLHVCKSKIKLYRVLVFFALGMHSQMLLLQQYDNYDLHKKFNSIQKCQQNTYCHLPKHCRAHLPMKSTIE